jgi:hypothetical protein
MKKVKLTFWIMIIGLLALLVFQNQPYFFTKHSLSLNLYFTARYTPDVPNLLIIAVFFAAGLLIAYLSSLFERFKANKALKDLRATNKSYQETVEQMRREVDALKQPAESATALETLDTSDVSENAAPQSPETEASVQQPQS